MVVSDLLFSIFLALIISVIFAGIILRKGPRRGFFWFFMLIFLAVFAVGIWGKPFGTPLSGSNWLPFLISGVLMALLLILLAPKHPEVGRQSQFDREETMEMLDKIEQEKKFTTLAYISFNVFLWVLLAMILVAIITRFLIL